MSYERRSFAGAAPAATLSVGIANDALSFAVASGGGTGYPTGGGAGNFLVVLDRGQSTEEKVLCSARSGDNYTVATSGRGFDGTSAQAHAAGATVEHVLGKIDADEANYAVAQTVGKVTTAEDILVATGAGAFKRLGKGADGTVVGVTGGALAYVPLTSGGVTDFTEAVQDAVAAFLTEGANIDLTYSDGGNTLTIAVTGIVTGDITGFTEAVQDVVGAFGLGGAGLTFTYNDGAGTAVLDVNVDGSTIEVSTDALRVKDGGITIAKLASGMQVIRTATSAPSSPVAGQQWYDTDDNVLYVYNGSEWVCISPQSSGITTSQSTSATSFTNLGTTGPAVSLLTGAEALVSLHCLAQNNVGVPAAVVANFMSVAVSGATTIAAVDGNGVQMAAPDTSFQFVMARVFKLTGLTPGLNTFTAKYRVSANTGTFDNRDITVVGLP